MMRLGSGKSVAKRDSAPGVFRLGRISLRAMILAAVLFGLVYANYVNGWISPRDLNFFGEPPGQDQSTDGV
jgi:predicted secreted protein